MHLLCTFDSVFMDIQHCAFNFYNLLVIQYLLVKLKLSNSFIGQKTVQADIQHD